MLFHMVNIYIKYTKLFHNINDSSWVGCRKVTNR